MPEIRIDPVITTADSRDFVGPEDWFDFHRFEDDFGGSGLTVVVNDSGVDGSHPVFDGIDVRHPDIDGLPTDGTDEVGHGTGVAGIIALLCPAVEGIINVPIFDDTGRTGLEEIITAYDWIIDRSDSIDFVNMSWGATQKIHPIDQKHNTLEQEGVDAVVAAGNTDQQTGSPATAERAFAIAACTLQGEMTRWSSPTDNVSALGRNIAMPSASNGSMGDTIPEDAYTPLMEDIGGEWVKASGTSFSCPMALAFGVNYRSVHVMGLDEPDVQEPFEIVFSETARDIKGTGEDGEGYIDYAAAVDHPVAAPTASATVWSMPWGGRDFIYVDADTLQDGEYLVNLDLLEEAFERR